MSGLIIHGRRVEVPGFTVRTWLDDPRLRLSALNSRARVAPVRCEVVHSESGGDPHEVLDGVGPVDPDHGARLADIDESDARAGKPHSQHLAIGPDGVIFQFADLADEITWHAPPANNTSIGVEVSDKLGPDGKTHRFYRVQLDALVALTDVITREFGIQRQVAWPYKGPVERLHGGLLSGVFGHRDQTDQRGPGDPGDAPLQALIAAGYEATDYTARADLQRWAERQRSLAARGAQIVDDGIPGPATRAAIKQWGDTPEQLRTGLWVTRPGD